ncbi:AMP-binding protein [Streptomyces axinellae]|uniref:AMP-dependent synthetase/ligase domain-containing protein n=1 Tax=Streptomyces axinellae TaxID=552788 RepID=A0ABP6D6R1_9ACTN
MTARARPAYEDKPWLAQLNEAQRAPVTPPETVLHAFRAAVREVPERTALTYFDGRLTYAETDALSDGIAAHLAATGLRCGDRLALMLQNTPHFVLADVAPRELAAYCAERLAACKYPREVEILPDLPKTTSGKILRRELRSRRGSA